MRVEMFSLTAFYRFSEFIDFDVGGGIRTSG